jgi:hypothetical protein
MSGLGPWIKRLGGVSLGLGALTILSTAAGCGGQTSNRIAVHPVEGKVEVSGEPAAGAFLVFHPTSAQPDLPRPTAKVERDGSFRLTTFESADGAPAGEYAVTIEWRKLVKDVGGEVLAGPNVVPTAYARPDRTPWKAEISSGPNDLGTVRITKAIARSGRIAR